MPRRIRLDRATWQRSIPTALLVKAPSSCKAGLNPCLRCRSSGMVPGAIPRFHSYRVPHGHLCAVAAPALCRGFWLCFSSLGLAAARWEPAPGPPAPIPGCARCSRHTHGARGLCSNSSPCVSCHVTIRWRQCRRFPLPSPRWLSLGFVASSKSAGF